MRIPTGCRTWLAAMTLLGVAACSDVVTPEPGQIAGPNSSFAVTDAEGGTEQEWWVEIHYSHAYFSPSTFALESYVEYTGDQAYIQPTIRIRDSNGAPPYERVVPVSSSGRRPLFGNTRRLFSTSTPISFASSCGGSAEADVAFRAVFYAPSMELQPYVWDEVNFVKNASIHQVACPPCPGNQVSTGSQGATGSDSCTEEKDEPQDPGNGGGGPCPECVDRPAGPTRCIVRYYYWKDTGEIYDTEILGCY